MTYGVKCDTLGNITVLIKGLTKEEAERRANESNGIAKENGCAEYMKFYAYEEVKLNSHEKQVARLIANATSEIIGGFENTLLDYPEDSEEYKGAKAVLNHDTLFEMIYRYVMEESRSNYASHIRFAGKKFIEERIEKRLAKEGYGA